MSQGFLSLKFSTRAFEQRYGDRLASYMRQFTGYLFKFPIFNALGHFATYYLNLYVIPKQYNTKHSSTLINLHPIKHLIKPTKRIKMGCRNSQLRLIKVQQRQLINKLSRLRDRKQFGNIQSLLANEAG